MSEVGGFVVLLYVVDAEERRRLRERLANDGLQVVVADSSHELEDLSRAHPNAPCFVERDVDIDIDFAEPQTLASDSMQANERIRELEGALARARLALQNALSPAPARSISGDSPRTDIDETTGLSGPGPLQDFLDREYARARRYGHQLSVLLVDIDDMERYCKRNGDAAGDAAMQLVADVLRGALRSPDIVARYQGDSFAVLATDTGEEQALALGDRLRGALVRESAHASKPPVTLSIGIVSAERFSVARASNLLVAAQEAAAAAHRAGGDRCCIATKA